MRSPSQPDADYLERIAEQPFVPMLIVGLHRSGTTWLYETLAELLPVASLTVYHVARYGQLLTAEADGSSERLKGEIDAQLRVVGADTRGFDEVPLSHATCEEYGWVLRRYTGKFRFERASAPLFREICQKLAHLQGRTHVLLKNPWDVGSAGLIADLFPETRFVFISRNPVRILDSQIRFLDTLGEESALLALVAARKWSGRLGWAVARGVRRAVGPSRFRRLVLPRAERGVCEELRRYREALRAIPAERRVEVRYEELVAAPAESLKPVVDFLGLPLERPLSSVEARPRASRLLPEVEPRAERFAARAAEAAAG